MLLEDWCYWKFEMPTSLGLSFLLLTLLILLPANNGFLFPQTYLSPTVLPSHPSLPRKFSHEHVRLVSTDASVSSFILPTRRRSKPPLVSSVAPAYSPSFQGPAAGPYGRHLSQPHHPGRHHAASPSPSKTPGCDQICAEPLTATPTSPFGSSCGCVLPMKIKLLLDVSLYSFFPRVNELEIEIAEGIYLQQSQVVIVGASADSQNQERAVVDVNLVPLEERFDNTTALLIYERFWQKKMSLNSTLFGAFEVLYISYPGLPSSPPSSYPSATGPSGNVGNQQYPITAYMEDDKSQKMNPRIIFVIVLSALVLLVICFGAAAILFNCRKSNKPSSAVGPVLPTATNKRYGVGSMLSSSPTSSTSASILSAMPSSILSVKSFTLAELEKATDKFSSRKILGEGGFGRVYHGLMEDGSDAAVKLLTKDIANGDREFISEVEMLSRLHHRNLVKLIGICIEDRVRCLVYELVPNGSVESHLHGIDKRRSPLDWDARLKIALGAARGLAYLHEDSNPRVIHRDFKASNVLLEDDFTPKVSDFGLAREATEGSHHISTRVMGTFGYVAPEYAMTGHLLVKSDVYSYGVVLLELLSGRKPVDMSQPQGQENLVTWARPLLTSREGLEQLVDPSLAETYSFDDMARVASIASMCVHTEVTHRPFMGEVVQALKLIYNDSDETCADGCSQRDSSVLDSDFKGDQVPSESSWWNATGVTPRLTYGQASSFITMDYSSGPLDDMENRMGSMSSLVGVALPIKHGNRSGPLTTVRSKRAFYRLKGSMSEHGLLPKRHWDDEGGNGHEGSV